MRKHIGQHRLTLIGRVLHIDIFSVGNLAHRLHVRFSDFTHADITLAGWRQLNVLLQRVCVGKGEGPYHRVLRLKILACAIELVHHGLSSAKGDARRQPHINPKRFALQLWEKIKSDPTRCDQRNRNDETCQKDSAQRVTDFQGALQQRRVGVTGERGNAIGDEPL